MYGVNINALQSEKKVPLKIPEIYVRYQSSVKKKNLLWTVRLIDSRKKQCALFKNMEEKKVNRDLGP